MHLLRRGNRGIDGKSAERQQRPCRLGEARKGGWGTDTSWLARRWRFCSIANLSQKSRKAMNCVWRRGCEAPEKGPQL